MQPLFASCQEALKQRDYAICLPRLREVVRTASAPEELVIAAQIASLSMLTGLELRLLRRAVRSTGCPAEGYLALSGIYTSRGRFLEAEEFLLPHLERPDWTAAQRAEGYSLWAISLAGRRRFGSAEKRLAQATALAAEAGDEAERDVAYAQAAIAYQADRWEEAADQLKALIANAEAPRLYMLLAMCQEHLGNPDQVLQTLQTACERFPGYPGLWIRQAVAAWTADRLDVVQEALDRFAALPLDRRPPRAVRGIREALDYDGTRLPVPPIRQGHNHCFPACLSMVTAYWGRQADQRQLGSEVMDGSTGTPLYRALHHLEQAGWVCRTFRATPERIKRLIDGGIPPILGLEYAGGAHVHVCVGYSEKAFLIQDPAVFHRRLLEVGDFGLAYAHSDYWALAFAPPESAGVLDDLPESDDRLIRRVQECWEVLRAKNLDAARTIFAELEQEPETPGLLFFRLRVWPRLGTKEGAIAAADRLLELFPDRRHIRLEVAEHLARLEQTERAAELIQEAPFSLPPQALMLLGRLARSDSHEKAISFFRRAAIADPEDAVPIALWGQDEVNREAYAKAEELFGAALEMAPSPSYQADMANLRLYQGRAAEAVELFRQVLRQDRVYPWVWWRRAEAHWALGQRRAAARCLRVAIAQDADLAVAVDRLSDLYEEMGQRKRAILLLQESPLLAKTANLQISLAVLLLNQEAFAETLTVTQASMAQFPDDVRFAPIAAEALRLTDRGPEALQLLQDLAERHPDDAYAQARYGRILLMQGETAAGLERMRRSLSLDPTSELPVAWAGETAEQMDDPRPVVAFLEEQVTNRPAARVYHGIAYLKKKMGDQEAHLEWLRKATFAADGPEQTRRYADELGDRLEERGDFDGITRLMEELEGRLPEAWRLTYIGYVKERKGDLEGALALYASALELEPDLGWALYRRPQALMALGKPTEAVAAFRKAARQQRVSPWVWFHRAEAHRILDQPRAAARCLRVAIAQEPKFAEAVDKLSDLYEEYGQRARAITLLRESPLLAESNNLQCSLAIHLLNEEEYDEALHLIQSAMVQFPDDLRFASLAAEALRDTHRAAEARQLLQTKTEQHPTDAYIQARFGRFLLLEGETEAGVARVRQAISLAPDWDAPLAWAESAAEQMDDPRPVLAFLEEAVTSRPTARGYYGLARLTKKIGEQKAHLQWLRKTAFATEDPEQARRYADELGDRLEEQGELDAIRQLMIDLAGRVPEHWRLTYLGCVSELQDKPADALPFYDEALRLDDTLIWTHYRYPLALMALGRKEEALPRAVAAAERWPGDAGLHWVAGRCHAELGQPEEAAAAYRRSIALRPDWTPPRNSLWSLLAKEGLPALRAQVEHLSAEDQASILTGFGDSWHKEDDGENAVAAWEAAVELDPALPDPYYRLAGAALDAKDGVRAWQFVMDLLAHYTDEAAGLARWLTGRAAPATSAAALTHMVQELGEEHKQIQADLCWLLGECHFTLNQNEMAVHAWKQAIACSPGHTPSLGRLAYMYAQQHDEAQLLALAQPMDAAGSITADTPWLLACYLAAALRRNLPRRPRWRHLIVERIHQIRREQSNTPAPTTANEKEVAQNREAEVDQLRTLYEQLEIEFGNLRAAWRARVYRDSLFNWLRVGIKWIWSVLRPVPKLIHPGESTAPAIAGPLDPAEFWRPGLVGWMGRNPLLLYIVVIIIGQWTFSLGMNTRRTFFYLFIILLILKGTSRVPRHKFK